MILRWLSQLDQLNRWVAYLYIPYQVLQLWGYRLAGKQCCYHWTKYGVQPIGPTSKAQHLGAGIFPSLVCGLILVGQLVLAFYLFALYYTPATPWITLFVIIQPLPIALYGYLIIFDFLRVRRLLREGVISKPFEPVEPHRA
jgi:hypothetical protein